MSGASRGSSRKRKHVDDDPVPEKIDDAEEMDWSDEEGGTRIDGIYIPPPATTNIVHKSTARLIITKITNNFFKSYAREQVLGPFSKCFNAIVGPNGSGKSNVIDSMLFVFGYRATKIRSKKISVLLHNSQKFRNVQSCTVGVHFCEIIDKPGEEYEIVPGSEFVVSRTACKDNSSYYHYNNKRVQFKEIALLLRKHGIDLDHNRFLILQGEVEEIATMKCKGANENETGMLEYLEDIIGTNRYKKPLAQLTEKIDVLGELRSEKLNRLNLVRQELAELEAPMAEAVVFLKLENTVVLCKNVIYQKNLYEQENSVKDIEEEQAKVNNDREQLIEKLKELAQEKSEKEATLQQEVSKYDNLKLKKDKLRDAYGQADKKDVRLEAEMIQLNNNRKKCKQQLLDERKKLSELEQIPQKNKDSIAECEAKEKEMSSKKEKLEEEKTKLLTNLRSETADLQKRKEGLEIELGHLKKAVNETKSHYDLAESELKIYQSNEESERNKLEKLRESIENNEKMIKQRTEEISQLKKKIPLTEKSLKDAMSELNAVRAQETQINNELKKKRMSLEETRSSMQTSRSRGKILESLMQQKREGNCTGLFGRLGDLGAIDQKYDVAISTACGPLDNIVVDTVSTAQWCIEFLKKHGIGRATFIALDKQEHLRQMSNTKIKTPENVHRLFDLIQIQDDTVKTAFYFALRDTLVADDLDQATRIAYGAQRYRVVTLKGDLIETSGTMSGGGRTASRGRMGQSVVASNINPKDIERMESDLRGFEDKLRSLIQEQTRLESQVNVLEPELNQMKVNFEKFSRDLQALEEQQQLLLPQLKRQEKVAKSTKADPKQVQKLTKVVNEKKSAFDEASEAAHEIQVDVDKLTDEIKEKTSGKMRSVDKSLSETTKTIDRCKAEITRLRVAITTSARNAKKSTEKISNLEQNIVDAENRLREMKAQREEIEADGKKLLKCIEEISEQLSAGEEEYSELKEEVKQLSKAESKLKLQKVDVDQLFKTVKEKLNNCNASIHQLNAKLNQLKLHDIPKETREDIRKFTYEELETKNIEAVELELQSALENIKSAKPNLNVIEEFRNGQNTYMQRTLELEEVTTKRNDMKTWFDKVKNQRKEEFLVGYNIIKLKLKEMYQMITLGGDADFEIVDSFDPFSEGIQFNVRPPKKSWKSISNLSGGEKTLSSLALVFALHYYKPSPLYVMDEIDAALDFKNVSIVGHYIKERTKNAQFIIISLRSNMFELCDNLIGIYKIENCTRTITINPNEFENVEDPFKKAVEGKKDGQNVHNKENTNASVNVHHSQINCASNQASDDAADRGSVNSSDMFENDSVVSSAGASEEPSIGGVTDRSSVSSANVNVDDSQIHGDASKERIDGATNRNVVNANGQNIIQDSFDESIPMETSD